MKVQGNGDTLVFTRSTEMPGYKQDLWFIKDAITEIIALKNLINQYRVTYDSIDQLFMVHSYDQEKPNMELKMHEYGIHSYNPTDKAVVLINTMTKKQDSIKIENENDINYQEDQ